MLDYEEQLELKLENGKLMENSSVSSIMEEHEVVITLPAKIEEVITETESDETETESSTSSYTSSSSSDFKPSVNIVEVTDIKECEGLQTVTECTVSEVADDDDYQAELDQEEEAVASHQVEQECDEAEKDGLSQDQGNDNWPSDFYTKEEANIEHEQNSSEQQQHVQEEVVPVEAVVSAAEIEEEGQESICRKGDDNNQADNEPNIEEKAVMEAGITSSTTAKDTEEELTDKKKSEDDIRNEMLKRMPTPKIPPFVKSQPPCAFQDSPTIWIEWLEGEVVKFKEEQARKKEEEQYLIDQRQKEKEIEILKSLLKEDSKEDDIKQEEIQDQGEDAVAADLDSDKVAQEEEKEVIDITQEQKVEESQEIKDDPGEECDEKVKDETVQEEEGAENDDDEDDWEWESGEEEEEEEEEAVATDAVEDSNNEKTMQIESETPNVESEEQLLESPSNNENHTEAKEEDERISDDKKAELEKGQQDDVIVAQAEESAALEEQANIVHNDQENKNNNVAENNEEEEEKDTFESKQAIRKHSDPMEVIAKMRQMRQNRLLQRHVSADGGSASAQTSSANPEAPAFMRTNSNPGETRNRSRPSSIVADDNLDDMLTRVKKLKEERQQILKDMAMLKDATSEEANETSDATTNDTTTNKESPISDDTDKDICDRGRQGSIDSGIGPSKSVTTDGGSSVVETRRVSHTSNRNDDENSDVIYCFICDEDLGNKLNKGAIMHMGLEDGEPICPEALNLTEKSKAKIRKIAGTKHFDLKAKYDFLETLDLDLITGAEYDITVEDALQKVENFLDDIEEQKKKDQEQFDLIRDGMIEEIFAAEFASDMMSEQDEEPNNNITSDYAEDTADEISEAASIAFQPPTAPPPPPQKTPPAPPPPPPPIPKATPQTPDPHLKEARSELLNAIKSGAPKLKSAQVNDKSEPSEAGKVLHKHLAPRVFTREVRDLMHEIQNPKIKLKKTKTNDRSKPYIPNDIEIFFYAGPNADRSLAPPPKSRELPSKRSPSPPSPPVVPQTYTPYKKR